MKHPSAAAIAHLERENARLRGDLLTLAKRFSHDLRTPLGGIVTGAEAVRDLLGEQDPGSAGLVDAVLNSAEEMTQLIKQVSFVARASASPIPKTPVHMAEPVFAALQRLESRLIKHQAAVREPPSWPVVPGVVSWLEVIWWHLLANPLKHCPKACVVELGWAPEPGTLRFWVADNGAGVPERLAGKLFRPFDALHAERDVPGLGLSIVQRLVELQGGVCSYEKLANGGARFSFTLPLDPPSASHAGGAPDGQAAGIPEPPLD